METRLQQLLADRAREKAALSESRRELRALKQQVARAAKAEARHWALDSHSRRVVLIAHGLSEYDVEAPAMYLAALGRQRGWPPRSEAELARVVEDEFLAVDEQDFAALLDFHNPADAPALRAAIAFVEEWRVAVWARRVFLKTGSAVPTAAVLRRFHANRRLVPADLRPPALGTVDEERARKWVGRWRTRWGGAFMTKRLCANLR